ncbi:unnamed protein product [Urochloa humidicola]
MSSRRRISSFATTTATAAATTSCRSPPPRAPHVILAAATERARSGTLRPEDAHQMFDELLRRPTRIPKPPLDAFLAALDRAPPSAGCGDCPALAVALFGRLARGAAPWAFSPTVKTYGILMDCCCRVRRPDLAVAFFGRCLKSGLPLTVATVTPWVFKHFINF